MTLNVLTEARDNQTTQTQSYINLRDRRMLLCSVFRSEDASCLLDNQHHTLKTEKVGKVMGAGGQCKDIYGPKSGICPVSELSDTSKAIHCPCQFIIVARLLCGCSNA